MLIVFRVRNSLHRPNSKFRKIRMRSILLTGLQSLRGRGCWSERLRLIREGLTCKSLWTKPISKLWSRIKTDATSLRHKRPMSSMLVTLLYSLSHLKEPKVFRKLPLSVLSKNLSQPKSCWSTSPTCRRLRQSLSRSSWNLSEICSSKWSSLLLNVSRTVCT